MGGGGRVTSFPFSKRSNSMIFHDCNFHCFLGFYATFFLWNAMSESAGISRVGLPIHACTVTDKL